MKRMTWLAVALGVVLSPLTANALLVEIVPNFQGYNTSDPTTVVHSVDVVVTLTGNEDLYAMHLDLLFDDNIISGGTGDVTDGGMFPFFSFGPQSGPGAIDYITGTLLGPVPGLGAGVYTFAQVDFTGVNYGTSPIRIANLTAINSQGQGITAFQTVDGSVTIAVPEPATMAMLAAGLGAMALGRRRRKAA